MSSFSRVRKAASADDQGQLGELGGLELEARHLEPGLDALGLGAERGEDGEEQEQGGPGDGDRPVPQPPVVEGRHGGHQPDADDHEHGLALEEVGGGVVVGPLVAL